MGQLGYMLKRFKKFNNERFEKHIEIISKNTGKSKAYIKWNWFLNLIIYGAGYTDYFRGDYINLTKDEKKTYVTAKSFHKILKKLNDKNDEIYLSDKVKFNEMFKDFIKRDYLDLRNCKIEDVANFIKGKKNLFAKPIDGFGGHGIEKIKINPELKAEKLYNKLMNKHLYLLEEPIEQCEELNSINPNSVASFRVVTLLHDSKAFVIGNALRLNKGKEDVIGCTEDMYFGLNEDGTINGNVIDDYGNVFEEHPLTKKSFNGLKLPYVKEAFEMCKKAALKLPKVRYIGWDVALTPTGPCIIEGNEYPGYGIIQFYRLNGSKTGHKKQIEEVIGKI